MITWAAPTNPGGVGIPILNYTIEIRLRNGTTFLEEPISCNGADVTIRDNRVCRIPMLTLTAAPFSFLQGEEIAARVTATNLEGPGPTSPVSVSQTVVAQVVPQKPPQAPRRVATTTESAVVVEWDALAAPLNGGAAVTSYNL